MVGVNVLFSFHLLTYLLIGTENEDNGSGENESLDLVSSPPVPPRKHRRRHTPPRPPSNGLPPTPKVHMGACFSKVDTEFYFYISY